MSVFTPQQVDEYLAYIKFPREQHASDGLERLKQLMKRHTCRFPFETLSLHYSPHRTVSLDPEALHHKMLVEKRGGFCLEQNELFGSVLRGLGYKAYPVAGRSNIRNTWTPLIHMHNIAVIDGKRYYVDVGMGALGPFEPVLLSPSGGQQGREYVQIWPRRIRIDYRPIQSPSYNSGLPVWILMSSENDAPETPWTEVMAFSDVELMPGDLEMMNYFVSTHPCSYFAQTVLAMRGIMGQSGEVEGIMVLHKDMVRRSMQSTQPETLAKLGTEEQRVRALEKYFDIRLSPVQQRSIRGFAAELKDKLVTGLSVLDDDRKLERL
ncbi:hypothetical protein CDD82_3610 [Ophiocordyceps australis]|uniref:Uncharacterized protein n=1 Tax=Ophiocordyceps australis TaxID=1399860 RepID=A0A2C5ZM40_9HYPO|nr:hypothetical protein CDD82_3610 [Ophiocordyceps australis]